MDTFSPEEIQDWTALQRRREHRLRRRDAWRRDRYCLAWQIANRHGWDYHSHSTWNQWVGTRFWILCDKVYPKDPIYIMQARQCNRRSRHEMKVLLQTGEWEDLTGYETELPLPG